MAADENSKAFVSPRNYRVNRENDRFKHGFESVFVERGPQKAVYRDAEKKKRADTFKGN